MTTHCERTLSQTPQRRIILTVKLPGEDRISLEGILRAAHWELNEVQTCQEALDFCRNAPVPVVLCEQHMPDGKWNALMNRLRAMAEPPAVIVVSRLADERLWVDVLSAGGYDVLVTPFDCSELFRVLSLAWMAGKPEALRMPACLNEAPVVKDIADCSSKQLCASSWR